jgi:2-haloacid dehalogenase
VSHEDIRNTVKVCMFDQYGTVVDMQGGLTAIAAPFLKAKGWNGDPNSFVTWWRRTHFENSMIDALLHRSHTPYREIGHRAVAHVMDRAGIAYSRDEVRYLVGEIEKLKPFPEVPAALERLHRRYQLVVLSNGDPDIWRRRSSITASRSTVSSRWRRRARSSRMSRPTQKPPSCSG